MTKMKKLESRVSSLRAANKEKDALLEQMAERAWKPAVTEVIGLSGAATSALLEDVGFEVMGYRISAMNLVGVAGAVGRAMGMQESPDPCEEASLVREGIFEFGHGAACDLVAQLVRRATEPEA